MKYFQLIFFILLCIFTSCNKKKYFDGANSYSDSFETITTTDDLFKSDKTAWTYTEVTVSGNYYAIDTLNKHSGKKCLKFFANKSTSNVVSKCDIAKGNMAFWDGDVVKLSAWYYIEGSASANWIFLFDFEEDVPVGAGPGMRIAIADDYLLLEHKYPTNGSKTIEQNNGAKISFPRNQWVNIELEVKLSQKDKGYVCVWQNGQLIITKDDWQTLPKDVLYFIQGTKGMYNSIQFGITANTKDNDMTLYLDDIDIKKIN